MFSLLNLGAIRSVDILLNSNMRLIFISMCLFTSLACISVVTYHSNLIIITRIVY